MSDLDPQKHLRRMWENAPRLAQAKANRVYMEEFRKTLKSHLMKHHESIPLAAQEREAYAAEEYRKHLEALKEAVRIEEELRWRMVTDQASVEVWRSQEASGRMIDKAAR